MPCMKRIPRHALRFTKTNTRRYTGQQQRTKNAPCSADQLLINRVSTARFVPPSFFNSRTCLAWKQFTKTKKNVRPLVSSQEQRALLVLRINRLSTADKPQVNGSFRYPFWGDAQSLFFSIPWKVQGTCFSLAARCESGFWIRQVQIRLFVLQKKRSGQCYRFAGGQVGGLFFCGINPTASRFTQPCTAPPTRSPPPRRDRALGCPGFGYLQTQIGFGTLVSSQERRAPLMPLINRGCTVCQPRVFFRHKFS